ncbi:MAG: CocE/NonD family hydrolase [Clostridiales bacterium]|jgi:putative CocE/NonD family hydrolase|nr:CocE/NonD family hydrolase [Clostridiales bacterium]
MKTEMKAESKNGMKTGMDGCYLLGKEFRIYFSGVYNGSVRFTGDGIELRDVDFQTRLQMKMEKYDKGKKQTMIDYDRVYGDLEAYAGCSWDGDRMTLPNGGVYSRYLAIKGALGGKEAEGQLWAQRKSAQALDIVTVGGKVAAFVHPGRISSEIAVLSGYESLTPLAKYGDPMLSKAAHGINRMGCAWVRARDGVKLATEVFLPGGLAEQSGESGPAWPADSAERGGSAGLSESAESAEQGGSGDSALRGEHEWGGGSGVASGPGGATGSGGAGGAAGSAAPGGHGVSGGPSGRKFPAIVVRTCYGRERDIQRCWHWVSRGYALVVQDVRGRSDSDGELVPFYYERDDADDLFSWIAGQEWSDGRIGIWGASYLGYTATAAATSGNPHLKTAISEVNVGSPFFFDTVRRGGTVCSWPLLCWTLAQSVSNRVDFDVFAGKSIDIKEAVSARPIAQIPEKIIGKKSGPWDIWARHYKYDDFWKHCDNGAHSQNIRIPMLIATGWYDGDAMGVLETWRFLTEHNVEGRRIVIGPWEHALNSFRGCRDLEFGDNAIDYDFDTRIIRWFDRYLKGVRNGEDEKPRATYYVVGENEWRTSSDWEPAESEHVSFYFSSGGRANSMFGDGRLLSAPDEQTGADSYVYDPDNPIGEDGHVEPYSCNHIQARNDCLVYDTAALEEDVAVAGNFSSVFYAASTAPDTDFIVRVSDVDEKGAAIKISDNVIRAEFRRGMDKPELLRPGAIEKYELEMYFNGYVFKKGHKIRADITSSNYYEFFPNTNTGIDPYDDPKPVKATQTIYHGAQYPSHVKIPVLRGGGGA